MCLLHSGSSVCIHLITLFHFKNRKIPTEYKLTNVFSFPIRFWGPHLYSYYSDRGTCSKCYLSCATCSGPRRDQCVTCPKDWQLASGECHPECPEGFFKSEFGCQKCHHYCKTCSGKFTKMSLPGTLFK